MKWLQVSVVLLAAAVLPSGAAAQEQAREARAAAEAVKTRFIGEWAYVPVTVVQGPYVTTYASSTTGIGNYQIDFEFDLPPELDTQTRGLDFIALLQRFDAQLALLQHFAIRVGLQGEGVLPDTTASALNVAVNGNWGVTGGLVAQLLTTDRMMLALTADYRFQQRSVVSPAAAFEDTSDELRLGNLLTAQDSHGVLAGGSFALAFTDWLGLVAEAGWEGVWPEEVGGLFSSEGDSYHFIDLGGALSANVWPQRIPIGLTGFWRERIPVGGDHPFDSSRQFGGGLFYTGRPWLDVGVEVFSQDDQRSPGNVVRRSTRTYLAPRIRGYF